MAPAASIVEIADAGAADHNAAGYAQAALDLAEGRRLLLRACAALRAEPHLPVPVTTKATKTRLLTFGLNGDGPATLAAVIHRVSDRIEGVLTLECPALRQRQRHPTARRGYERSSGRG